MSSPLVRMRLGAEVHDLVPGDIIGRAWSAALSIDDGRVSEAHALVSLRGGELKLLALRGRFSVGDKALTEVVLVAGQRLQIAEGVVLEVVAVSLPSIAIAIEGRHLSRQILMGVCSLLTPDATRLVPGFHPQAVAQLWSRGSDWSVRIDRGEPRPLSVGDEIDVRGETLRAVAVPLAAEGAEATVLDPGMRRSLHIVAKHDSVTLQRSDGHLLHLTGLAARILSELAAVKGPIGWEPLATELWSDESERAALRRRFDVAIARLRRRLRDGGMPPDLVAADGAGNFELVVGRDDVVEDRG